MSRSLRASSVLALTAAALLLVSPGALTTRVHAQSYTVVDSVRLPAESFVGDPVELRYTLRTTASLSSPESVVDPPWGEISSVRVIERGDEIDVRIAVVPYEPGTLTLPRIDLGPVTLEGLSLIVASVLEEGAELRPVYGPQRLPGTLVAIVLLVLGLVLPVVLALYLLGPGKALVREIADRYRARLPYRNLMRTIDSLEASIKRQTARSFYSRLVRSLQDLMTSRLGFDCRAATSSELRRYLPAFAAQCRAQASVAAPLADVLATADAAKFGRAEVRRKTRKAHLVVCREVAAALEASRRGRGGERGPDRPPRREPTRVGV
ncbi:MAG: hypothetical protein ACOCYX_06525 [Spirochaetota bacterium]